MIQFSFKNVCTDFSLTSARGLVTRRAANKRTRPNYRSSGPDIPLNSNSSEINGRKRHKVFFTFFGEEFQTAMRSQGDYRRRETRVCCQKMLRQPTVLTFDSVSKCGAKKKKFFFMLLLKFKSDWADKSTLM